MLHGKSSPRKISFRYDLLDKSEVFKKALTTVADCSVAHSALADIKRTARFSIRDDGDIDFLNDRIQPFVRLQMPGGGFAEWSQGIFLLSSPERKERTRKIYRDVEAYDGLQVLQDDKFEDRYSVAAGMNYITAITTILTGAGITKTNLEASALTLPSDREWEPGTTKLAVINALLSELNYIPIYVDEYGYYTSRKYVSPDARAAEYTYADDELSVIYNGLVDKLDLFSVANKFVAFTSNPDAATLRSVYTNSNALSPLSTVSRGRTITDVRKLDSVADQATLDSYVARIAFEASQVFGYVTAETAIMPMHSHNDVVRIEYSAMGIYEKFTETGWTMQLQAGARMRHDLRRVITL
jgi:hypothetical protein